MEAYMQAVVNELRHARSGDLCGAKIETIYIGGGTPTVLSAAFLCEIITEARRFEISAGAEITVECNPFASGTDATDYFAALRAAGVNRLSIGLQAWQDGLLRRIGRSHTSADFVRTFHAAREAGFANINVDLMFALPGQTMADWRGSLDALADLCPEHISTYSLTPAEGTPLWDWLERGDITLPDEDVDRAMYHEAERILAAAGYKRYEISNFAQPGRESRHNLGTWTRQPYRGFGLGAHSFDVGAGDAATENTAAGNSDTRENANQGSARCHNTAPGGTRWHNTADMTRYLQAWGAAPAAKANQEVNDDITEMATVSAPHKRRESEPHENNIQKNIRMEITKLTVNDALAEVFILGLRLADGVCLRACEENYGKIVQQTYGALLKELVADGLLEIKKGRVRLTPLGTDLANQVMVRFL